MVQSFQVEAVPFIDLIIRHRWLNEVEEERQGVGDGWVRCDVSQSRVLNANQL
jgi:hypothetical protein